MTPWTIFGWLLVCVAIAGIALYVVRVATKTPTVGESPAPGPAVAPSPVAP